MSTTTHRAQTRLENTPVGYGIQLPRVVGLTLVGVAVALSLLATTLLVLFALSLGPGGIAGVPVVLVGGLLLVAVPTLVWELGLASVDVAEPTEF
jgi:hypothetical protein